MGPRVSNYNFERQRTTTTQRRNETNTITCMIRKLYWTRTTRSLQNNKLNELHLRRVTRSRTISPLLVCCLQKRFRGHFRIYVWNSLRIHIVFSQSKRKRNMTMATTATTIRSIWHFSIVLLLWLSRWADNSSRFCSLMYVLRVNMAGHDASATGRVWST